MADHLIRNLAYLVGRALEGQTQMQLAKRLGVAQPTVSKWSNPNRKTASGRLPEPEFRGVMALAGLFDLDPADLIYRDLAGDLPDVVPLSQPTRPDPERLGPALVAMEKALDRRGLSYHGRLGQFANLLAFAYDALEELFPDGVPDEGTPSGKAALRSYDRKVYRYLTDGIADGAFSAHEGASEEGTSGDAAGAAQRKTAGSR